MNSDEKKTGYYNLHKQLNLSDNLRLKIHDKDSKIHIRKKKSISEIGNCVALSKRKKTLPENFANLLINATSRGNSSKAQALNNTLDALNNNTEEDIQTNLTIAQTPKEVSTTMQTIQYRCSDKKKNTSAYSPSHKVPKNTKNTSMATPTYPSSKNTGSGQSNANVFLSYQKDRNVNVLAKIVETDSPHNNGNYLLQSDFNYNTNNKSVTGVNIDNLVKEFTADDTDKRNNKKKNEKQKSRGVSKNNERSVNKKKKANKVEVLEKTDILQKTEISMSKLVESGLHLKELKKKYGKNYGEGNASSAKDKLGNMEWVFKKIKRNFWLDEADKLNKSLFFDFFIFENKKIKAWSGSWIQESVLVIVKGLLMSLLIDLNVVGYSKTIEFLYQITGDSKIYEYGKKKSGVLKQMIMKTKLADSGFDSKVSDIIEWTCHKYFINKTNRLNSKNFYNPSQSKDFFKRFPNYMGTSYNAAEAVAKIVSIIARSFGLPINVYTSSRVNDVPSKRNIYFNVFEQMNLEARILLVVVSNALDELTFQFGVPSIKDRLKNLKKKGGSKRANVGANAGSGNLSGLQNFSTTEKDQAWDLSYNFINTNKNNNSSQKAEFNTNDVNNATTDYKILESMDSSYRYDIRSDMRSVDAKLRTSCNQKDNNSQKFKWLRVLKRKNKDSIANKTSKSRSIPKKGSMTSHSNNLQSSNDFINMISQKIAKNLHIVNWEQIELLSNEVFATKKSTKSVASRNSSVVYRAHKDVEFSSSCNISYRSRSLLPPSEEEELAEGHKELHINIPNNTNIREKSSSELMPPSEINDHHPIGFKIGEDIEEDLGEDVNIDCVDLEVNTSTNIIVPSRVMTKEASWFVQAVHKELQKDKELEIEVTDEVFVDEIVGVKADNDSSHSSNQTKEYYPKSNENDIKDLYKTYLNKMKTPRNMNSKSIKDDINCLTKNKIQKANIAEMNNQGNDASFYNESEGCIPRIEYLKKKKEKKYSISYRADKLKYQEIESHLKLNRIKGMNSMLESSSSKPQMEITKNSSSKKIASEPFQKPLVAFTFTQDCLLEKDHMLKRSHQEGSLYPENFSANEKSGSNKILESNVDNMDMVQTSTHNRSRLISDDFLSAQPVDKAKLQKSHIRSPSESVSPMKMKQNLLENAKEKLLEIKKLSKSRSKIHQQSWEINSPNIKRSEKYDNSKVAFLNILSSFMEGFEKHSKHISKLQIKKIGLRTPNRQHTVSPKNIKCSNRIQSRCEKKTKDNIDIMDSIGTYKNEHNLQSKKVVPLDQYQWFNKAVQNYHKTPEASSNMDHIRQMNTFNVNDVAISSQNSIFRGSSSKNKFEIADKSKVLLKNDPKQVKLIEVDYKPISRVNPRKLLDSKSQKDLFYRPLSINSLMDEKKGWNHLLSNNLYPASTKKPVPKHSPLTCEKTINNIPRKKLENISPQQKNPINFNCNTPNTNNTKKAQYIPIPIVILQDAEKISPKKPQIPISKLASTTVDNNINNINNQIIMSNPNSTRQGGSYAGKNKLKNGLSQARIRRNDRLGGDFVGDENIITPKSPILYFSMEQNIFKSKTARFTEDWYNGSGSENRDYPSRITLINYNSNANPSDSSSNLVYTSVDNIASGYYIHNQEWSPKKKSNTGEIYNQNLEKNYDESKCLYLSNDKWDTMYHREKVQNNSNHKNERIMSSTNLGNTSDSKDKLNLNYNRHHAANITGGSSSNLKSNLTTMAEHTRYASSGNQNLKDIKAPAPSYYHQR